MRDGMKRFSNVQEICGAAVSTVTQESDWATVFATMTDGKELRVRARFVIGCDGGRSSVRKAAGLTLESLEFEQPWVVVDTKTRSGAKDPQLPRCKTPANVQSQAAGNVRSACRTVLRVSIHGAQRQDGTRGYRSRARSSSITRICRSQHDRHRPYRLLYVPCRLGAELAQRTNLTCRRFRAPNATFPRAGNVFGFARLPTHWAGLDLVLGGKASSRIFDDYEAERRDHVVKLIKGAMFLGSVIQTRNRWVAFLRNLLLFMPSRNIKAAEETFYRTAVRKEPLSFSDFSEPIAVASPARSAFSRVS